MIALAAAFSGCSDKAKDTPAAQMPAQTQAPAAKPAEMPNKPKADMATATVADAAPDGKSVYNQGCVACHAMAIAGAPKFGDAAVWEARLAQGIDVLYENSINGYKGEAGIMPPKGGRMDLSDEAVKAAVDYMVQAVK